MPSRPPEFAIDIRDGRPGRAVKQCCGVAFQYIAGFGPIGADPDATHAFWATTLGIPFDEIAPAYFHAQGLGGAKAFALWPLAQAAEATFGTPKWPTGRPVPQAWIEFEVSSPEAVADTAAELRDAGQEILVDAHEEPWG